MITTMIPSLAEAVALVMLVALTVYAVLGGADFGGGVWDLLATGRRAEDQRDLIAQAIGPVWEANHVWLIVVIVLLFCAFPPAFTAVMTALHLPLALMLVGIVLRGSAFTFRAYDSSPNARRRWSRMFSIPSVLTPILLGSIVGAIATGRIPARPGDVSPALQTWLSPFALAVGFLTLATFAFLAAVYLILETNDSELKEAFRLRALVAAVAVGVFAYAVFFLARTEAPLVYQGLSGSRWGFPLRVATGVIATSAILALVLRYYSAARALAVLQTVLVLFGCASAQAPYIVPPGLSIADCAAPPATLRLLLIALGAGSLLLIPSLLFLFSVFKSHAVAARQ